MSQGAQAYAAPSADAYVISGYTRPAQQPTAAAQQNYYAQQPQQGAYPAAGKVPQQAAPRPAAASTAYPTYAANTAGVAGPGTTSYGFTQPQQTPPPPNKGKQIMNYKIEILD